MSNADSIAWVAGQGISTAFAVHLGQPALSGEARMAPDGDVPVEDLGNLRVIVGIDF